MAVTYNFLQNYQKGVLEQLGWLNEEVEVIERINGRAGELQLQRRGDEFEVIYNGVFLMATYNGLSEKAAVSDALKIITNNHAEPIRVLMGGLGVGYSLQEALSWEQVEKVVVAEIEPAVIRWSRDIFGRYNNHALEDIRCEMFCGDFREFLENEQTLNPDDPFGRWDLIMVDTDNGNSWLSLPGNAFFYGPDGLDLMRSCLVPGGITCFWCSRREETFESVLGEKFSEISFHRVMEKTGQEGCYYMAFKTAINNR
ncbi:MAG: spermine/spermidine synthase [Bacillota bacterium]|nr:spermine/spermidine synthase [Bacillota bacterium]